MRSGSTVVTSAVSKLCGTYSESWIRSDRRHDRDDNMFFDCKRTGVELHAKEYHVGNVACPYFANGVTQKLRYELFRRGSTQHTW
jgi:hypothetical protein